MAKAKQALEQLSRKRWVRSLAEKRREAAIEKFLDRADGVAEGTRRALLTVLRGRGLEVTSTQEQRILACRDATQLDAWLTRAATATSVDELLDS